MIKKVLILLFSLVLVWALVSVGYAQQKPAAPKVYNWRLQSTHMASDITYTKMFPYLSKKLDELSNGRIKFTYFHSGQLVPVGETLSMLGKGVYEMSYTSAAYWGGTLPVAQCEFGFPGAWYTTVEMMELFYDRGIHALLREAYAPLGVRYLAVFAGDPWCLESKVKVRNLDELKKLKVRTLATATTLLNKLGVKTVSVAFPELYMALKLGTVDACTVGLYTWYQNKFPEVTKYVLWPPIYNPTTGNLLMNLKTWNELPPDLKQAVDCAVVDTMFYMHRYTENDKDLMFDILKKDYGVEFIDLPAKDQAEIARAGHEIWADLAKMDKYTSRFMKIIEEFAKYKGRIK